MLLNNLHFLGDKRCPDAMNQSRANQSILLQLEIAISQSISKSMTLQLLVLLTGLFSHNSSSIPISKSYYLKSALARITRMSSVLLVNSIK